MNNHFNSNIKYIRTQKKMSQTKMAELVGVDQATIARWENEERIPTIDKAIDVSNKLNIPLNILLHSLKYLLIKGIGLIFLNKISFKLLL